MSNKLKLIYKLKSLDKEAIDEFKSQYGLLIQGLIQENNGNEEEYKKVLSDVISELHYRVSNEIDFDNYDVDILVYTLAYMAFKTNLKEGSKKSNPIILSQNYYELASFKMLSRPFLKKEKKFEEIINSLGEPGRTILRLSFFEKKNDKEIAKHVHFESEEKLRERRVQLIDRCIEISDKNGR